MRYYFNIISSAGDVKDLEGIEISSIEDARLEAIEAARQIMSNAILEGRDVSGDAFEICDETGENIMIVEFQDAVPRR